MSKKVGHTTVRVRYAETDPWGIDLHSNYCAWFELAWMEFFGELDYSFTEMRGDGVSSLMTEATCGY